MLRVHVLPTPSKRFRDLTRGLRDYESQGTSRQARKTQTNRHRPSSAITPVFGAIRNGELTGNVSGRACATGRPTEEIRRPFFHRRAAGVDPLVAAYRVLRLSVAVFLLASPSWLGLSDASRTRSWVWPFAVRVSPIDFARRKIK